MKKILFVVPNLMHGGSNKCLENMLSLLRSDAALFHVVSFEEEQESQPYAHIFGQYLIPMPVFYSFCRKVTVIRKALNACWNYLHLDLWQSVYRITARQLQRRYQFDLAVGFQESYSTHFASHFPCRKIAWVHCDYDDYKIRSNNLDELKWYRRFEQIVCVSKYTAKVFAKEYKEIGNRVTSIYNPLDVDGIRSASEEHVAVEWAQGVFSIVSVGRFAAVKQFHKIPEIVRQVLTILPEARFCWLIIGDGDQALIDETTHSIAEYGLANYVKLLGAKDNPYPYIAQSDLLVSTSYSEACPYVVNEAKILHTPVVSMNYPTASEMLEQGRTGYAVSMDSMAELLADLIEDKEGLYTLLKASIKDFNYDNSNIISQMRKCFQL